MPTLGTNGTKGWEELSKQTVQRTLDLSGSDGPTSGNHLFEQFDVIEPAGGLDRNELAELVAYERETVVYEAGGGGSNPAQLQFEWENTMAPDAKMAGKENSTRTTDLDSVTGADKVKQIQEDDPDTIDFYHAQYSQTFEDNTNGTGGASPGSIVLSQAVNFREMFKEGPVLDRHDRIYSHVWEKLNDDGWEISEQVQLYWDVTEE